MIPNIIYNLQKRVMQCRNKSSIAKLHLLFSITIMTERTQSILAQIRELINRSTQLYLPSISTLSKELRTSPTLIGPLLRQLHDEGLIKVVPKHRTIIISNIQQIEPVQSEGSVSRRQAVLHAFRKALLDGYFTTGEPLPKRIALMREFATSGSTLSWALTRLEREGLICKQGNSWFAGSPAISGRIQQKTPKVILLVQPRQGTWSSLLKDRTLPLLRAFSEDMERRRISVVPIQGFRLIEVDNCSSVIDKAIATLGQNYQGSLVIGQNAQWKGYLPDVFLALQRYNNPVVWINRTGEPFPGECTNAIVECVFNDSQIDQTAFESLCSAGHRSIGFIAVYDRDAFGRTFPEWANLRLKRIQEAATRRDNRCRIISFDECVRALLSMSTLEVSRHIESGLTSSVPVKRKTCEYLVKVLAGHEKRPGDNLPIPEIATRFIDEMKNQIFDSSLLGVVEIICTILMEPVTALIFANDQTAAPAVPVIAAIGIKIPEDLSLVSIDNYLDFIQLPVSTIDPGGGPLGHQAFHALLDSQQSKACQRQLQATPFLVERGSIALPHGCPNQM